MFTKSSFGTTYIPAALVLMSDDMIDVVFFPVFGFSALVLKSETSILLFCSLVLFILFGWLGKGLGCSFVSSLLILIIEVQ